MSGFDILTLLGGLAMFLYGMRLMGNSLKEGSSGALKRFMERLTNNPLKAFLLGLAFTAVIQSSTATIVIMSGLVAAGILSLKQSIGVIIGANVGTTVTGQIIRFIGVDAGSATILKVFTPSTLAPAALLVGIILIVFLHIRRSDIFGNIFMGFGILFTGLMTMTSAVGALSASGAIDTMFSRLGTHAPLGYVIGAAVAFALQSSSATIGILQTFSMSGAIQFNVVCFVLAGVYLGDCVTTGIVCSIGAKPDAKRVGAINILYNLAKTAVVLLVLLILRKAGVLDSLWTMNMNPGSIANTNTIFNLGCAILLLPTVNIYYKASLRLVKDEKVPESKYADKLNELNPVILQTPALAFNSCYDILKTMLEASCANVHRALETIFHYDEKTAKEIREEEDNIDMLTDSLSTYLTQLSPYTREEKHVRIMDQYNRLVTEFERLGDQAEDIVDVTEGMYKQEHTFSDEALEEIRVVIGLLDDIFECTKQAFEKQDVDAANQIEPLEEVMDDLVNALHDHHLIRLRDGLCTSYTGISFLDILSHMEKVSDICSNVGVSVIIRARPELASQAHSYITSLHQGDDNVYEQRYQEAHNLYFGQLEAIRPTLG